MFEDNSELDTWVGFSWGERTAERSELLDAVYMALAQSVCDSQAAAPHCPSAHAWFGRLVDHRRWITNSENRHRCAEVDQIRMRNCTRKPLQGVLLLASILGARAAPKPGGSPCGKRV